MGMVLAMLSCCMHAAKMHVELVIMATYTFVKSPAPFQVTCLFMCPVYHMTALILDSEYCGEIFSVTLYLLFHLFRVDGHHL